jgi:dGTPase
MNWNSSISLAPYATAPELTRGRTYPEEEHPYRNPYQRDRDRIIHSAAFRRLEFKTQVFGFEESDYVRTRLTHTIEVAQLARTVARALHINEDLTEAIALSHDLGHPPFGHAGERSLDECMRRFGGFDHNLHGLRIVDRIEERYGAFPGLNLTYEVREAFAKHGSARSFHLEEFYQTGPQPTLEAQVVDRVDELAYISHDLDDGLKHGRLTLEELRGIALWDEVLRQVYTLYPRRSPSLLRHEAIRRVINLLVTDLIEATLSEIKQQGVSSLEEVRQLSFPLVRLSPHMDEQARELKEFLYSHLYTNYLVLRRQRRAQHIIRELFQAFSEDPRQLPPRFYQRIEAEGLERVVCDYIAGMTDRYALEVHAQLFGNTSASDFSR